LLFRYPTEEAVSKKKNRETSGILGRKTKRKTEKLPRKLVIITHWHMLVWVSALKEIHSTKTTETI